MPYRRTHAHADLSKTSARLPSEKIKNKKRKEQRRRRKRETKNLSKTSARLPSNTVLSVEFVELALSVEFVDIAPRLSRKTVSSVEFVEQHRQILKISAMVHIYPMISLYIDFPSGRPQHCWQPAIFCSRFCSLLRFFLLRTVHTHMLYTRTHAHADLSKISSRLPSKKRKKEK